MRDPVKRRAQVRAAQQRLRDQGRAWEQKPENRLAVAMTKSRYKIRKRAERDGYEAPLGA